MVAHIRPVTNIPLPRVRLTGAARVNAGMQTLTGDGALPTQPIGVQGHGTVVVAIGDRLGSGALSTKSVRVANGVGQAFRRARGPGTLTAKKTLVAGVGLKVVAVPAVVILLGPTGQPAGYGPSNSPYGVFYGRTDLLNGDVWWVSTQPVVAVTVTARSTGGGDWTAVVGGAVAPGTYTFTWTLRKAASGVRSTGTQAFTVA